MGVINSAFCLIPMEERSHKTGTVYFYLRLHALAESVNAFKISSGCCVFFFNDASVNLLIQCLNSDVDTRNTNVL